MLAKTTICIVSTLVLVGAACSPLNQLGILPIRIEGVAMNPELNDGDRIFISREFEKLERGDIVVFYHPLDHRKSYIKRVIALPNDKFAIRKGKVLLNGKELAEPYVVPENRRMMWDQKEVVVPTDRFYVMGDNRDQSNDSRAWGALSRKLIYGKVLCRYYSAQ